MTDWEAIAIIRNEIRCVENDSCRREECFDCPLVMDENEILTALNMAIEALTDRKTLVERLSEKMAYMNMCPNEQDIILGSLGVPRSSEIHCNTDCWHEQCDSYHYAIKEDDNTRIN